jgi:hypothetical protein
MVHVFVLLILLEALGFKRDDIHCLNHGSFSCYGIASLWQGILPIYESGLNIMIKHTDDENEVLVLVDNKSFQIR